MGWYKSDSHGGCGAVSKNGMFFFNVAFYNSIRDNNLIHVPWSIPAFVCPDNRALVAKSVHKNTSLE